MSTCPSQLTTPYAGALEYFITPEVAYTPSEPSCWGTRGGTASQCTVRVGTVFNLTESRHVEFKKGGSVHSQTALKEQICKYGSAFLNSGGGTIYYGVLDNGMIEGIHLTPYKMNRISKQIEDTFLQFDPCVGREFYEIVYIPCNIYSMYVVAVSVRSGKECEVYSDAFSKMYIKRDGSIHGPLWPRDIKNIVLDKLEKRDQKQSKS